MRIQWWNDVEVEAADANPMSNRTPYRPIGTAARQTLNRRDEETNESGNCESLGEESCELGDLPEREATSAFAFKLSRQATHP